MEYIKIFLKPDHILLLTYCSTISPQIKIVWHSYKYMYIIYLQVVTYMTNILSSPSALTSTLLFVCRLICAFLQFVQNQAVRSLHHRNFIATHITPILHDLHCPLLNSVLTITLSQSKRPLHSASPPTVSSRPNFDLGTNYLL